jgi:hypothetical protein
MTAENASAPAQRASNNIACWKCGKQIEAADNYCRHCGKGQGSHIYFYYKHWGVWILFFIIGPFNLWFLWRSPVIKIKWKLIYGAIFLFLSCWVCYVFYKAVSEIFNTYAYFLNIPF